MKFKYHNILTPQGYTISSKEIPFAMQSDVHQTLEYLKDRFPYQIRSRIRIVDLGALEGGYAVNLAAAGFNVTIIEARTENVNKCRWVVDQLNLPIKVICEDAKNLVLLCQEFHVVLCLGLLYHFDKPVEFLQMAARCTQQLLILNTHYARPADPMYDRPAWQTRLHRAIYKRFPGFYSKVHNNLSMLTWNEGCIGRWYKEYSTNANRAEIERSSEAAYSNQRSFWPVHADLVRVLHEVGFSRIINIYEKPKHDRAIFVCLKQINYEE